jgi:hypothetical protein
MQNRYVGDIGDFAKYALLRRLTGGTGERRIRLGVIWCLYPDETHNSDGRHITYFRRSELAELDPELLAALRLIVESGRRSVSSVAAAQILPYGTTFCDALACLPKGARGDRLSHRSYWLQDCLRLTQASELVFFDPDNGFEIASAPKHHAKAGKYIYWDELAPFWRRGQALLIYHHLNRTKLAADQVAQLSTRLRTKFASAVIKPLVFRRGSCRVFWLVCPRSHVGCEVERRSNDFLNGGWKLHFRPFD